MMQTIQPDFYKTVLKNKKNIIISSHKAPDGDAIGSSLALKIALEKLGHNVTVVVPDDFPGFLKWMPFHETILRFDQEQKEAKEALDNADIFFSLDYNDLRRIGDFGKLVEEKNDLLKVMIDHHRDPKPYANYALSDISASSTCELIFRFLEINQLTDFIDKDVASCIYTGLLTDTGSFRFSSTTAKTHEIAAFLLKRGAENAKIYELIYDNSSIHRLQLLGYAITEKLEYLPEYRTAIISLTEKELKKFHYQKGDTEGIVNYPLSVKNIVYSIFISEKDGLVKLSMRSKGNFPVNEIASKYFDGGGHLNAAGAVSDVSVAKTIEKIKSFLPKYKDALLAV
jgi:phosphoesterase RecJ-like protein